VRLEAPGGSKIVAAGSWQPNPHRSREPSLRVLADGILRHVGFSSGCELHRSVRTVSWNPPPIAGTTAPATGKCAHVLVIVRHGLMTPPPIADMMQAR
jgi:hypothetical protein